jgi:hypothetical protein
LRIPKRVFGMNHKLNGVVRPNKISYSGLCRISGTFIIIVTSLSSDQIINISKQIIIPNSKRESDFVFSFHHLNWNETETNWIETKMRWNIEKKESEYEE